MAGIMRSSVLRNVNGLRRLSTSVPCQNIVRAPIQMYGVEGRYAHAIYSAAVKSDALKTAEKELNAIQAMLKEEKALAEYCYDPTISKLEKRGLILDVLKAKKFSDLTVNFIGVVAEENRLKRAEGIIIAFNKIMRAVRGEVDCTVTTAKPLNQKMTQNLKGTLKKFVKETETLKIEMNTDPALIGGMIINMGEYYIDMSTATKIKRITRAIKAE